MNPVFIAGRIHRRSGASGAGIRTVREGDRAKWVTHPQGFHGRLDLLSHLKCFLKNSLALELRCPRPAPANDGRDVCSLGRQRAGCQAGRGDARRCGGVNSGGRAAPERGIAYRCFPNPQQTLPHGAVEKPGHGSGRYGDSRENGEEARAARAGVIGRVPHICGPLSQALMEGSHICRPRREAATYNFTSVEPNHEIRTFSTAPHRWV